MGYIPNTLEDQKNLLKTMGKPSVDALFSGIPEKARLGSPVPLPPPLSEPELLEELKAASEKNTLASQFLGAGCYGHFVPSVVKHIVSRSEFYTAYTPYQAEASQGILQAIFEYQSMVCALTGMDVANASMYDGATAMAEAAFLACRATARKEIAVSSAIHPEYRKVLQAYCQAAALSLIDIPFDPKTGLTPHPSSLTPQTSCFILQQPNFFGNIEEVSGLAEKIHGSGALFMVCADPISLGALKAPGKYGADIVVGEGQSLGNPRSFGGPGLGIFAAKSSLARQVPGRIVGQTVDAEGRRGYCLTLQAREQHIRRERATSNICSNEALAALAATVYLSAMGKSGLRKVAELCLQKSNYLKKGLGNKVLWPDTPSFKEFAVRANPGIGFNLGSRYPGLKGARLVCVTELANKKSLDRLMG